MLRQGFLFLAQPLMEPSTVDTSRQDKVELGTEQDTSKFRINWFLGYLTMIFQ
jgi:hypothetical protein